MNTPILNEYHWTKIKKKNKKINKITKKMIKIRQNKHQKKPKKVIQNIQKSITQKKYYLIGKKVLLKK